jgi:hypothetical protein
MSNFYSLLKQSIVDRGISDDDDRQDIYAQAREAVLRKLLSYDPPLGEDEIEARIELFDVAVTEIEADLVAIFAGVDPPYDEAEPDPSEEDDPQAENQLAPLEDEAEDEDRHAHSRIVAITRYRQALQAAGIGTREFETPPAETDYGDDDPADDDSAYAADDDRAYWRGRPPALEQDEPWDGPREEPYAEDEVYADDAAYAEDVVYGDDPADEETGRQAVRPDRWSADDDASPYNEADTEKQSAAAKRGLSERNQVRVLIGAIGFLFLALIGFVVYMLMPANTGAGGDQIADVIAASDTVRREVSDAATAARIPIEDIPVTQSFAVFDGLDPTVFDASPGNPVLFDRDNGGGFARVSSGTGTTGVRVLIGPGLAARLAGQRVRVILVARGSDENGAASMRFAYQSGLAISHWQTANLSSQYAPLGLVWRVPSIRTSSAGDALLIEPGIPGDGSSMDIQSIRIDLLAQ